MEGKESNGESVCNSQSIVQSKKPWHYFYSWTITKFNQAALQPLLQQSIQHVEVQQKKESCLESYKPNHKGNKWDSDIPIINHDFGDSIHIRFSFLKKFSHFKWKFLKKILSIIIFINFISFIQVLLKFHEWDIQKLFFTWPSPRAERIPEDGWGNLNGGRTHQKKGVSSRGRNLPFWHVASVLEYIEMDLQYFQLLKHL